MEYNDNLTQIQNENQPPVRNVLGTNNTTNLEFSNEFIP